MPIAIIQVQGVNMVCAYVCVCVLLLLFISVTMYVPWLNSTFSHAATTSSNRSKSYYEKQLLQNNKKYLKLSIARQSTPCISWRNPKYLKGVGIVQLNIAILRMKVSSLIQHLGECWCLHISAPSWIRIVWQH